MGSQKRKAAGEVRSAGTKKAKYDIPEYHLAPSRRDGSGEIIWPAPKQQIEEARDFILKCAKSNKPTLILPDKDADGLSSGVILYRTLTTLGLRESLISVYFPPKGVNIHDDEAQMEISERNPSYVFILDQGSRKSPPIATVPHQCLVIDHHFAEEGGFPEGAQYVTAHDCPPVATSSLLTYHICEELHPSVEETTSWLAALGTHGDLGNTLKWLPPFPDMTTTFKQYSKKAINDAVALINAPRRSAAYNVQDAWSTLLASSGPEPILKNVDLMKAKNEVSREIEKWARTAPLFSADATVAVIKISSPAQVHPVIAQRWSGTLSSKKLEIAMCANEGYLPGLVNFSCRIVKSAKEREGDDQVNIIKKLRNIVAADPDLEARMGPNFARGHKEASGGIVRKEEFDDLMKLMGVGPSVRKKAENGDKKEVKKVAQKNTLANYFQKSKVKEGEEAKE